MKASGWAESMTCTALFSSRSTSRLVSSMFAPKEERPNQVLSCSSRHFQHTIYIYTSCVSYMYGIILYYTILYYSILCYAMLYYTILYYTILYYTTLHYTTLHYTILYYTILYYTILYYTILYYTILYYR